MLRQMRALFRHTHPWSLLIFLGVILVSLRDVLLTPGMIGHVWDWDMPALPEQLLAQTSRFLYVWDYQFRGGVYSPYRPEGLYWFLTWPLAFFGGEVFSRVVVILLMLVAAVSMQALAVRVLRLNAFWSTLAGILYMLSPVFYSRLMAGHMHLLTPYALLPLLLLLCTEMTNVTGSWRSTALPRAVAAGLILGLEGIHPSFLVISFIVAGGTILLNLLWERSRKRILASTAVMGLAFALVSSFWALPSGIGYLTTGTLFHSGWPTQQPDQVTASSVMSARVELNQAAAQPIADSLRMQAPSGVDVEFAYPVPLELRGLWTIVSYLLPLLAFGALLTDRGHDKVVLVLALVALLGATLVSGPKTPLGALVAEWLLAHAFPVWAEFANTLRALPLLALSYGALVPLTLESLSLHLDRRKSLLVASVAVVCAAIYVSPFLSARSLLGPVSLALSLYRPSAEDAATYNKLASDGDDFRVAWVAPPWLYFPEYYDLGYEWLGGLSPHPEFYRPYFNSEAWRDAANFRSPLPPSLPGRMLGLGAVKYVIYPRGKLRAPSSQFYPPREANYAPAAQSIDRVLESQPNLVPITGSQAPVVILRNESFVPHIYAATTSALVEGNGEALRDILSSSLLDARPAIFFDRHQSPRDVTRLASEVGERIVTQEVRKADDTSEREPARLFTFAPFSETTASFSISNPSTQTIRVRVEPFRSFGPGPDDVTMATFNPAGDMRWSGNVPFSYEHDPETGEMRVFAYFRDAASDAKSVVLEQSVDAIDLTRYPYLRFVSQVGNVSLQGIQVALGLDWDGDGARDAVWTSPLLSHKSKEDDLNVLDQIKREYGTRPQYQVISLSLRFTQLPKALQKGSFLPALYAYGVRGVEFHRTGDAAPAGVIPVRFDLRPSPGIASLRRSISGVDAQRYPVYVRYVVDGPATLFAAFELTLRSESGQTQTLTADARLLEPFSQGIIALDVREPLSAMVASDSPLRWLATDLKVTARHLVDRGELRPTTLNLAAVGSEWGPTAQDAPSAPPTVWLDGRSILLRPMPEAASQQGMYYTSEAATVSSGPHRISASYPDTAQSWAIGSIEIVTKQDNLKPVAPPGISFDKINPTRYQVHVENSAAPFFLVFSEGFHTEWKAFVTDDSGQSARLARGGNARPWYVQSALLGALFGGGKQEEIPEHYRVNGYANAWYITRSGTFDVLIEFVPQRLYEVGLILSLTALFAGAVYVGLSALRGRK